MKPSRPRAHLIPSFEPLVEGQSYTALCGVEVVNARWKIGANPKLLPNIREVLGCISGLCRHCFEVDLEGRYVYAAVAGSERQVCEEEKEEKEAVEERKNYEPAEAKQG